MTTTAQAAYAVWVRYQQALDDAEQAAQDARDAVATLTHDQAADRVWGVDPPVRDSDIREARERAEQATADVEPARVMAEAARTTYRLRLGKMPDVETVPLREAAEILGVEARAAESALRRAEIRSGYPVRQVQWLSQHRPGRGSRTDLTAGA